MIEGQLIQDGTATFQIRRINPKEAGKIAFFARVTPPDGWLKANGAAVLRVSYPELFAAIGTTFGAGDGSTTFALPDLRGEFIRAFDDGRGVDVGRVFGSAQGDAIRNFSGCVGQHMLNSGASGPFYEWGSGSNFSIGNGPYGKTNVYFDPSRVTQTAAENRPRNIALMACIKY